jgi:thioredoxin 1
VADLSAGRGDCRGGRGDWQVARSSSTGFEPNVQEDDVDALASTDFDAEKLDFLQEKFLEADTSRTGKLGASAIRRLLECTDSFCYSLHVMTKDETLEVMKKFDVDGDDKLSFSEFVKFANDKLLLESHLQTYESAFKKLDKDGNGQLEAREIQTMFDTLVQEGSSNVKAMSESEVKALVKKYSQAEADGLTFQEFLILGRNVLPEVADLMKYLRMAETDDEAAASKETTTAEKKKGGGGDKKGKGGGPLSGLMNMLETSLSNNVEVVDKKRWKKKQVNEVKSMEEFQLLLREEKGPIVLEVGFTFCKPCKKFQPKYNLFAEHYEDVLFLMVYGNRNQSCKQLCKTILNVKATPTFYMYSNGSLVDKHVGIKEDPLRKKILALKGN